MKHSYLVEFESAEIVTETEIIDTIKYVLEEELNVEGVTIKNNSN